MEETHIGKEIVSFHSQKAWFWEQWEDVNDCTSIHLIIFHSFCHMCHCSDCLLFISLVREAVLTLNCIRFPHTWHSPVDGWAWQQLTSHTHQEPGSTCCFPRECREQVVGSSFVVKRRWGIPGSYKDVVGLLKYFLGTFLGLSSFWKWHSPTQFTVNEHKLLFYTLWVFFETCHIVPKLILHVLSFYKKEISHF